MPRNYIIAKYDQNEDQSRDYFALSGTMTLGGVTEELQFTIVWFEADAWVPFFGGFEAFGKEYRFEGQVEKERSLSITLDIRIEDLRYFPARTEVVYTIKMEEVNG